MTCFPLHMPQWHAQLVAYWLNQIAYTWRVVQTELQVNMISLLKVSIGTPYSQQRGGLLAIMSQKLWITSKPNWTGTWCHMPDPTLKNLLKKVTTSLYLRCCDIFMALHFHVCTNSHFVLHFYTADEHQYVWQVSGLKFISIILFLQRGRHLQRLWSPSIQSVDATKNACVDVPWMATVNCCVIDCF